MSINVKCCITPNQPIALIYFSVKETVGSILHPTDWPKVHRMNFTEIACTVLSLECTHL